MTSEYVSTNIDLQVREIVVAAASLPDVSHVLAGAKLESLLDDDSSIWFWRELERQFDIVVTRAQRATLPTVGDVVRYLKLRKKMEANG
jgi:acyl carrier protein